MYIVPKYTRMIYNIYIFLIFEDYGEKRRENRRI